MFISKTQPVGYPVLYYIMIHKRNSYSKSHMVCKIKIKILGN